MIRLIESFASLWYKVLKNEFFFSYITRSFHYRVHKRTNAIFDTPCLPIVKEYKSVLPEVLCVPHTLLLNFLITDA